MAQTETLLKVQPHASIRRYSVLDYALLTIHRATVTARRPHLRAHFDGTICACILSVNVTEHTQLEAKVRPHEFRGVAAQQFRPCWL